MLKHIRSDTIKEFLQSMQVPYRWVEHPPIFTVADSAAVLTEKTPIKNLLLTERHGDRICLVIMSGTERLDLAAIARRISSGKLHFANTDILFSTMGVTPGSVSIFGLLHPNASNIEVIIDARLQELNELGFHPNDNTATVFIPVEHLERILRATGQHYMFAHLY